MDYSTVQLQHFCSTVDNLNMNIQVQAGGSSFKCHQCDFSHVKADNLRRHMLGHGGEVKPFSCTQCSYTCKTSLLLKVHMRTHSREKPFSCTECNYTCTQAGSVKIHMLKHTGEVRFSCNKCNYMCAQKQHLKRHMLWHSGEKPFSCTNCNFTR